MDRLDMEDLRIAISQTRDEILEIYGVGVRCFLSNLAEQIFHDEHLRLVSAL
jgi:hypothetical protein